MIWTVQCAEYYLYRGVSRTHAYEFMQQSGQFAGGANNAPGALDEGTAKGPNLA